MLRWAAWRRSLRFRLLLGTVLGIVAILGLAAWGLGTLFHQHVQNQFQAELRTHLDQLTAQLSTTEAGTVRLAQPLSDPRFGRPYSGYYWQVDALGVSGDGDGAVRLRSRSLWDLALVVPPDALADGELHLHTVVGPQGASLRLIERSVRLGDSPDAAPVALRLVVAADAHYMEEPVAQFNRVLWLALAGLGVGLVLAALAQVVVGLSPLRTLHDRLGRVRAGQAPQLEGDFPNEVMPLVTEFNTVLAQNAAVVERARTHAGNLAHALKTPLTVLSNAAQAPPGPDGALARLVLEQVALARRQVDYHLARAQAAAAVGVPGARTELLPVVQGLVRVMQRVHAERALQIALQPWPTALAFQGEAQDLQEMVGNLLDNACKWAAHRVVVAAEAAGPGARLRLVLEDDGPGLDAPQRQAVLQRGVRADEQVPGSGLGLAIVDDLARLYGGQVVLEDSPLGGLRAVLTLPAAH